MQTPLLLRMDGAAVDAEGTAVPTATTVPNGSAEDAALFASLSASDLLAEVPTVPHTEAATIEKSALPGLGAGHTGEAAPANMVAMAPPQPAAALPSGSQLKADADLVAPAGSPPRAAATPRGLAAATPQSAAAGMSTHNATSAPGAAAPTLQVPSDSVDPEQAAPRESVGLQRGGDIGSPKPNTVPLTDPGRTASTERSGIDVRRAEGAQPPVSAAPANAATPNIITKRQPLGSDTGTFVAPAAPTATAPLSGDVARSVPIQVPMQADPVAQVSEAIKLRTNERSVTVRLDPPELGTVRIDFTFDRGAVTAVVAADQPSTGDLLRRHSEWLHQAMAEAGIEGADISWAEAEASAEDDAPWDTIRMRSLTGEEVEPVAPQDRIAAAGGRIDLRL